MKPIKDLEIKSLAVQKKEVSLGSDGKEHKQTDFEMTAQRFGSKLSQKAIRDIAKTLPQQRRAMRALLKERLGKV